MIHTTISAPLLKIFYKLMEDQNQDTDALLRSVSLSKEDLMDVSKRIPYEKVYALWLKATELIDDPCYAIKAALVCHPSDLNALGYAWLSSSTLRAAFERLHRFQTMITEFAKFTLVESEDQFEVLMNVQDENMVTTAQYVSGAAILLRMCRVNYGDSLTPSSVSFVHEQPDCFQQYIDYFGCDILFSQPCNKLSFSKAVIDEPLFNSAPNMAYVSDRTMMDYLESMHESNLVSKVKQAIINQLPSDISVINIADRLNMTPRTLHRHLKEQGTSFKEILDDIRFELSKQYIKDNRYNITEIAFNLGFSDSSSFSRAFKNWSGHAPTEYKRNHHQL